MNEQTLFVLEDNEELILSLSRMAEDLDFTMIHARCVETGVDEITKAATNIANHSKMKQPILMIDLMLPSSETDLRELDLQLKQRNKLVEEFMLSDSELTTEKTIEARLRLRRIDDQIRSLVNIEGGLEFLREIQEYTRTWQIIVFSARTSTHLRPMISEVTNRSESDIIWLRKPVDPDIVREILAQIRE